MCSTCSLTCRRDDEIFPMIQACSPPARARRLSRRVIPHAGAAHGMTAHVPLGTSRVTSILTSQLRPRKRGAGLLARLGRAWAPADDRVPPPPPTRKRREWGRIDIVEKASGRCEGSCCKVWQSNPLRVIAPKQLVWGQIQLHFFSNYFS